MGKEIRRVPKNWKHPKDKNGKYQPSFTNYMMKFWKNG